MISSPSKVDYSEGPIEGCFGLGLLTIGPKDIVLKYTVPMAPRDGGGPTRHQHGYRGARTKLAGPQSEIFPSPGRRHVPLALPVPRSVTDTPNCPSAICRQQKAKAENIRQHSPQRHHQSRADGKGTDPTGLLQQPVNVSLNAAHHGKTLFWPGSIQSRALVNTEQRIVTGEIKLVHHRHPLGNTGD